jgi:hypothetical protein
MKNLLILPGGSPRQLAWAQKCESFFSGAFDTVQFIQYDHWQNGGDNVDSEKEIPKIKKIIEKEETGDWYVFGKSIGSILAMEAVSLELIKPVKCVFFGMPFSLVSDDAVNLLSDFTIPSIAFHNIHDPKALYDVTKEKIDSHATSIKLITLQGDTHDYLNFEELENDIKNFIE